MDKLINLNRTFRIRDFIMAAYNRSTVLRFCLFVTRQTRRPETNPVSSAISKLIKLLNNYWT